MGAFTNSSCFFLMLWVISMFLFVRFTLVDKLVTTVVSIEVPRLMFELGDHYKCYDLFFVALHIQSLHDYSLFRNYEYFSLGCLYRLHQYCTSSIPLVTSSILLHGNVA